MHTKRFITFLKIWLQFRVGVIPRLPFWKNFDQSIFDPFPFRILLRSLFDT